MSASDRHTPLFLLAAAALASLVACGGGGGDGGAAAPVVQSITPSSGFSGSATPVVISGDNFLVSPSSTRIRAWLDDAELSGVERVDVHTLHATVPAGLSAGAKALRVENAFGRQGRLANAFRVESLSLGALAAAVEATPTTGSVGQTVSLRATIENVGTGTVTDIQPNEVLVASADGAAATVAAPEPPSVASLAPGASATFTWQVVLTAVGHLDLTVSVAGNDTFSGLKVPSPPAAAQVVSELPAGLVATVSVSRPTVNIGQAVTATLTVTNGGEAAARVDAVTRQVVGGAATCGVVTPSLPVTVPSGGSRSFAWACTAATAASLTLSGTATGVDVNSSLPISATPAVPAAVEVQTPAALAATLAVDLVAPPTASVGQSLAVLLTVRNTGGASADVTSVAVAPTAGVAACTGLGPATPQVLQGGTSLVFSGTCIPAVAGTLNLRATVTGSDANTGDGLSAGATLPAPITVQLPPGLAATVSVLPGIVDVNQGAVVSFTVTNGGGARANNVAVTPAWSPTAAATCAAATPTTANILPGGSQLYSWTCTPSAAGALSLTGTAAGTDANSGLPVTATPATPASATVQTPAALSASISVDGNPTNASVGQGLTVRLTVNDTGGASATLTGVTPSLAGATGSCTAATPALPQTLTPGVPISFTWTCVPSGAGGLTLGATVAGADRNSGAALSATASLASPITVQQPPALTATVAATSTSTVPGFVDVNQAVTVTYTVVNGGGAQANGVAVTPAVGGTAAATCGAVTPASASIAAGANQLFTRTCTPSSVGTLTFTGTAAGTDANSGQPVSATPSAAASLTVQAAAALAAAISVTGNPTSASVGQVLNVQLLVSDPGGASARVTAVTPTNPGASGSCTAPAPAPPQVLTPPATATFTWSCTPSVAGSLTLGATVGGTDRNSGASLSASATLPAIAVQLPPVLAATVSASPGTVDVNQDVNVSFTVTNGGGAQANGVVVTPAVSGTAAGSCVAATPASANIAAGSSQPYTWTCRGTGAGTLALTGTAAGTDANSGQAVTATPTTPASVTVQTPAVLGAALSVDGSPTTVSTGQALAVHLTVSDTGGASANVTSVAPSIGGVTGSCTAATPPATPAAPQPVSPGAPIPFTWTCTPSGAGSMVLGVTVGGADRNSGGALSASAGLASPIAVQLATALAMTVTTSRATVDVSQAVTVTYTVTNGGGAQASAVAVTPSVAGTATASCTAVAPASANVAAGGSQTFSRTCTPTSAGTLTLSGTANGTDANSGSAVAATPASAAAVAVQTAASLSGTVGTGGVSSAQVGQSVAVTLQLQNGGGATAHVTAVTPTLTAGTCTGPSPAAPFDVSGSGSVTVGWSCTPSAAGGLTLGAAVTASDANTTFDLTTPVTPAPLVVSDPLLSAGPLQVAGVLTAGTPGGVSVSLQLTNNGSATVRVSGVAPSPAAGALACGAATTVPEGNSSVDLAPGGGSKTFAWTCSYDGSGAAGSVLTAGAAAAAVDLLSSADVSPSVAPVEIPLAP